eukprot:CAMPEP_0202966156 /NCGR_PEP_ID=MMETSP1396-20130829/10452_1 /ASSEMBLY_ACC=CAM_ASM_000872 /TAXON_ID= /ORGANISM="Pseudokeronopsis sp., Strain Brazil" /LENGTH=56 /DNA_ID=CAMNT_0049689689 /DNA_START=13 /DNA_END=179 /DNA_ORIENTATION=-
MALKEGGDEEKKKKEHEDSKSQSGSFHEKRKMHRVRSGSNLAALVLEQKQGSDLKA